VANNPPAAAAEPMTPATLGAMACMTKKFCGLLQLRPRESSSERGAQDTA